MSERSQQLQVGVVFMLGIIVLISGVLWFKDFRIGGSTYNLKVEFPTTSGLVKGDPVEVRGVVSGKVSDITYEGNEATVTLQLENDVQLYQGTKATIENVGIMGQKLVSIVPGPESNPPLPPDTTLQGGYQPGIPQLMAGLGGTLETLDRFASRLDTLLAAFDETQQGQLTQTLANTEVITSQLADLLSRNRKEMGEAISSFNQTMKEMDRAMEGRGDKLGVLIDNAATASDRLDSTLVALQNTADHLDRLIGRVEDGQGTAGRLVNDEALYQETVETLARARALLDDIQKNPRRYFKVSVF